MKSNGRRKSGELRVLTRAEARVVRALCDTIIPQDGAIDLSVDDTGAVQYLDDLLAQLPLKERLLLRAMFQLFELQHLVTRPLSFSRFSRASKEDRAASIAGWETSELYPRRAAFQALRSLVLWAYVDNPSVEQAIGKRPATGERLEGETDTASTARRHKGAAA